MSVSKPDVGCVFKGVILILLTASMQIFLLSRSLSIAVSLGRKGAHIIGNIGSLLSFNSKDKKR